VLFQVGCGFAWVVFDSHVSIIHIICRHWNNSTQQRKSRNMSGFCVSGRAAAYWHD